MFAAKHAERMFWSNLLCSKNVKSNNPASAWHLIIDRFILEHQSCTITEVHRQAKCKDFTLTVKEREREICLFASNLFNKLPLKTQKKKNNNFTF